MWFRKHEWSISNISPVSTIKKTVVKEGFPVTKVSVKTDKVTLNSYSVLSKLPHLSQHELEIALGTGQDLKEVNSKIFDISDSELNDLQEAVDKIFDKEINNKE